MHVSEDMTASALAASHPLYPFDACTYRDKNKEGDTSHSRAFSTELDFTEEHAEAVRRALADPPKPPERKIQKFLIKPKGIISFTQVVCLLLCLFVLAYPIVLDMREQHHSDEVIQTIGRNTADTSEKYAQLFAEAEAYNATLANTATDYPLDQLPPVDQMIVGDGQAFAWIELPTLNERIPIYHGTTFEVLQQGVGHISDTSLPIGGPSTHTVLTGHSGMAKTRMFDDIPTMRLGDIFMIHVLDRTLAYKVIGWDVVTPDDNSTLQIQQGRDLCSLITCYPYGVNTHRYIVHGERTNLDEIPDDDLPSGSFVNKRTMPLLVAMGLILLMYIILWRRRPKEIGHQAKGLKRLKRHDKQLEPIVQRVPIHRWGDIRIPDVMARRARHPEYAYQGESYDDEEEWEEADEQDQAQ